MRSGCEAVRVQKEDSPFLFRIDGVVHLSIRVSSSCQGWRMDSQLYGQNGFLPEFGTVGGGTLTERLDASGKVGLRGTGRGILVDVAAGREAEGSSLSTIGGVSSRS